MTAPHPALPAPRPRSFARHLLPVPTLRIALVRGDGPSAVAQSTLGDRLARRGHEVRASGSAGPAELARCLAHRPDVAVLAPDQAAWIPLLRARGVATAVQVTGGGATGRRAGLSARVRFALREADAITTDLQLVDDELARHGVPVEVIRPGVPAPADGGVDRVALLRLVPGAYHLATGDAEIALLLEAHRVSGARLPIVLAGPAAPPAAVNDGLRTRVLTGLDAPTLAQLRAHALTSLHAGAADGTDPHLAAAMASGTAILARETPAHRELAGTAGFYATDVDGFARHLADAERYPQRFADIGALMAERAASRFDWDRAAESWEALASRLSRGWSSRGLSRRGDAPGA